MLCNCNSFTLFQVDDENYFLRIPKNSFWCKLSAGILLFGLFFVLGLQYVFMFHSQWRNDDRNSLNATETAANSPWNTSLHLVPNQLSTIAARTLRTVQMLLKNIYDLKGFFYLSNWRLYSWIVAKTITLVDFQKLLYIWK